MYLSYSEYVGFGGTLDEATFLDFEFEACAIINHCTFNRLRGDDVLPMEVKMLVLKLISIAVDRKNTLTMGLNADNPDGAYIREQSNDGVVTKYGYMEAVSLYDACKDRVQEAVYHYLSGVKNSKGQTVLYRGLYPGE